MPDYSKMSNKELEQANHKLMAEKDAIRAEQRKIASVLDDRAAEAKVASLSSAELSAIAAAADRIKARPPAQTVSGVGGIKSQTKFGDVGGGKKRSSRR